MHYSPDWEKLREEFKDKFWCKCGCNDGEESTGQLINESCSAQDALDWFTSKLQAREEWLKQEAELWMLRLHNEPEKWTVEQAMRNLFTTKN